MAPSTKSSFLGVAARDVSRLQKVASIVVRHGFGEILLRIPFAASVLGTSRVKSAEETQGSPGERFTHLLAELGPTYIKLGQVLSMRADLLPADFIKALSTLQDDAPKLTFEQVKTVVESGLGHPLEELFADFDPKPLATASIGQIHRATTLDGAKVVVKAQRPGIGETMRGDLDLLYLAAKGLEASIDELRIIGPASIVAEFEKSLLLELNFNAEMANLVRAKALLDPARPITVPEPRPDLTARTVLTMGFFDGKPIRMLEPGSEAAKNAIEQLLHVLCKGIFVDGFFHGDPHAGNILIDEEGTLCLIDMGMVGTLSPEQRDDLMTLVLGTIVDDAATVARVLLKMGTPTERVDIGELKREIVRVRSQYMVSHVGDLDTQGFINDFANAVGKYRVRLATEYSVLVKAAGTVEGLVRALYPDVDALAITKPYVEQLFAERFSPENAIQHALGGSVGAASLLRTLPTHLDQILHDVETGNVQIQAATPTLDRLPDTIYQSATRLAVALFATAMTLSAAITLPERYEGPADWIRLVFFLGFAASSASAWTVTWWWHFFGRKRSLRLAPVLRFFRGQRS